MNLLRQACVPVVAVITAAVLAALDVATTLYALAAFDGDLVEGNPASLLVGSVAGPVGMCLAGAAATMALAAFTATVFPAPVRAAAWLCLAVKAAVVVSNFVHIGLAW